MAQTTIKISGMSCQHCVMNVKKALDALDGVSDSTVEIGSARVTFDEARVSREDLEAAVKQAGYQVAA